MAEQANRSNFHAEPAELHAAASNKGAIEKNRSYHHQLSRLSKKVSACHSTTTNLTKTAAKQKQQTTKWTIRNANLNQQLFIKTLREILRL